MANDSNKSGSGAIAVSVAALAAAAAGAFYFYGSSAAPKHRRKMKSWILRAQSEVMERMENMQKITQQAYDRTVDEVMETYKKIQSIPTDEIVEMAKEMKGHWDSISKQLKSPAVRRAAVTITKKRVLKGK